MVTNGVLSCSMERPGKAESSFSASWLFDAKFGAMLFRSRLSRHGACTGVREKQFSGQEGLKREGEGERTCSTG